MTQDRRAYGAFIRDAREAKRLTMLDVAQHLGFRSLAYVSDVERGQRSPFTSEQNLKLATLLGVDPLTLIRLAAEVRGWFEVPAGHVPDRSRGVVAALCRGQMSDEFWNDVMTALEKESSRG